MGRALRGLTQLERGLLFPSSFPSSVGFTTTSGASDAVLANDRDLENVNPSGKAQRQKDTEVRLLCGATRAACWPTTRACR